MNSIKEVLLQTAHKIGEMSNISVFSLQDISQKMWYLFSFNVDSILELLLSSLNWAQKRILDHKFVFFANGNQSDRWSIWWEGLPSLHWEELLCEVVLLLLAWIEQISSNYDRVDAHGLWEELLKSLWIDIELLWLISQVGSDYSSLHEWVSCKCKDTIEPLVSNCSLILGNQWCKLSVS